MKSIYYCFCRNTQRFVNETPEEKIPTNKTPLLSGSDTKPGGALGSTVLSQPFPELQPEDGLIPVPHKPLPAKSAGRPRRISVGFTNVKSVDKRIQDQGKLYNDYFKTYEELKTLNGELCDAFDEFDDENRTKSLESTFRLIKSQTHSCVSITLNKPTGHGCTRIQYDQQEVPTNIAVLFNKFNSAAKLMKELTDKGSKLKESVRSLLKDEMELRRDVLAASMGVQGPDAMKMCIGGVSELKKVPSYIDDILKNTHKIQKRANKAVSNLSVDGDIAQMSEVMSPSQDSSTETSSDNKKGLKDDPTPRQIIVPEQTNENESKVRQEATNNNEMGHKDGNDNEEEFFEAPSEDSSKTADSNAMKADVHEGEE